MEQPHRPEEAMNYSQQPDWALLQETIDQWPANKQEELCIGVWKIIPKKSEQNDILRQQGILPHTVMTGTDQNQYFIYIFP
jgi:hypothetical protein